MPPTNVDEIAKVKVMRIARRFPVDIDELTPITMLIKLPNDLRQESVR